MSTRKPTEADLPVWWCYGNSINLAREVLDWTPDVHWQPATLPERPKPKEQWMQDLEARDEAWATAQKVCRANGGGWFTEGWNMALAYRDKQNREDLEALGFPLMHTDKHPVLASLRRRCGLDQ